MKKYYTILAFLTFVIFNTYSQKFASKITFEKFESFAKKLNSYGFEFIISEKKGDISHENLSYSAMLLNGNGSLTIKMMNISEFEKAPSIIADMNTGIYEKYDNRLVFWSLDKAKQGFLYVELKKIDAVFIISMQPENTQEQLEATMLKIGCLKYFTE